MTVSTPRLFALIPAAGHSRRMGRPKLLLPWNDSTVVEHLLCTLTRPEITATIVVLRAEDRPLQAVVARTSAVTIIPERDPPTMRDSVEIGLRAIRERFGPTPEDAWLLIPADHPLLEPEVLNGLLARWARGDCDALVPTFGDRRGHPTLLRWTLAEQVEQLPPDVGVNRLLRAEPRLVTEWPTDRESVLADLDTPEDYAVWQRKLAEEPTATN